MANQVGAFERHVEEEPQRGDGGVYGRRADLLLGHMQLKAANVLTGWRCPANDPGRRQSS